MASSSLKRYIDDFDCSTENENFEGFDSSEASEIEKNYIECNNESADSGDDDIVNARDWCEITATGLSESPRFPSIENNAPLEANYTTATWSGSRLKRIYSSTKP
ncbi:DDE_Tnp_1_7 domain-containing protein [Nephila pilipes]|uniref:DDE_Tnp_1_7 domain-containing protein n=1 Tax=Nephila pilipes TaxID=299642 RepID=A0A8X6IPK9_NEPPI|nr:DDE_Tnp_1_7 domain-containing protein [Nephila pilipes]